MCSCDRIAEEFALQKLGLRYEAQYDFVRPSIRFMSGRVFAVYRVCLALAMLAWLVSDCVYETLTYYVASPGSSGSWFLFATNWSFMICTAAFLTLAILAVRHHCNKVDYESNVTGYQVAWLLYNVGLASVCVSCICYWFSQSTLAKYNYFNSPASKVKHSLTLIIVLFDLMIGKVPINLLHVVYIISVGLIYTIFYIVFYFSGGQGPSGVSTIYPSIDWRSSPGGSVTSVLLVLLLALMIHCFIYIMASARDCGCHENARGNIGTTYTHEEEDHILDTKLNDARYSSFPDNSSSAENQ